MKNILFYGNCQASAINNILNLNRNEFNIECIECFSTEISENDFLQMVKKCDIIITQMIHDGYREKNYLATRFLLENTKSDCQILFFNNLYFDFYYFDLCFQPYHTSHLDKPSLYHYTNLMDYYKKGLQMNEYIHHVIHNEFFLTEYALNQKANSSLNELKIRYNEMVEFMSQYRKTNERKQIHVINVIEYIRKHYKNKLLFYTFNHPCKELLHEIAHQMIAILKIANTMNYHVDPFDWYKGILYKCIQRAVTFDITKEEPKLNDETDIEKICKIYYESYQTHSIQF